MIISGLIALSGMLVLLMILYQQRKRSMIILSERNQLVENQKLELMKLNEVKDKLLSMISHDFRAPLVTLHAMMELVDMGVESEEDLNGLVQKIRKHLKDTIGTLDNVIYWSRTQMDGFKLKPEEFNLYSFADSIIGSYHADVATKKLTIENRINQSIAVTTDKEMLTLILRNLMTNAIKFSHPAGSISISTHHLNGHLEISVQDEGVGISDEIQKKLQLNEHVTTPGTKNEKGTGMGLLLSKELATKLGGKISIKSDPSNGSTFTVTIPMM